MEVPYARKWQKETEKLRKIALDCGLTEELKWGKPCFTWQKSNVAIVIPLKESCALSFVQGALLKDPHGILMRPGQHTQAGRWIKFTALREIAETESVIKAYLREALAVEKAGLKVPLKKTADYKVPDELQVRLDEFPKLKAAFSALTPGRQRAYILHFSAPKLAKTRETRVDKWVPHILKGKGLNDE